MEKTILLKMENVSKRFGSALVLNNVNFELRKGEVHVLCGENGAGKSTLMKILSGIHEATEGTIYIEGQPKKFKTTRDSEAAGIAIIHQELSLCSTITVAENMFLGNELTKGKFFLDRKAMKARCDELFGKLNFEIDINEKIGSLTIAQQQLVQIAKALSMDAKILIMDEPFSSLSDEESEILFGIMDKLRKDGVGIIYIDHRIDNFYKIGDRVTVLRDGNYIGCREIAEVTRDEIISMMVGRELNDIYPKYNEVKKEIVFKAEHISSDKVDDISFEVKKGEIFGLGGLVGAGRSETLRAIFGVDKKTSGSVEINGKRVEIKRPTDAIKAGIAYIPEDRKREGLVLKRPIRFNSSLVTINKFTKGGLVNKKQEKESVEKQIDALKIKLANMENWMTSLSGGNQQKVVISKWLMEEKINVLIMDEPTRGIDVGAKYEIYRLMNDLANQGMAIILVTSDLPELLNLSDRVMVLKNGKSSGLLEKGEMTQEGIMQLSV